MKLSKPNNLEKVEKVLLVGVHKQPPRNVANVAYKKLNIYLAENSQLYLILS